MVLPLLASCLALTLLAGTLLTMFTARRVVPPATRTTSEPQTAMPTPTVGQQGAPLPAATVVVDGAATPLSKLHPAVLILVPVRCGCARLARQLATQAGAVNVGIYFAAASGRALSQAQALARQARNIGTSKKNTAHLLTDQQSALASAYQPRGLTAVLVDRDGSVSGIYRALQPMTQLGPQIQELDASSPVSLDRPAVRSSPLTSRGWARPDHAVPDHAVPDVWALPTPARPRPAKARRDTPGLAAAAAHHADTLCGVRGALHPNPRRARDAPPWP